MWNTIWEMWAGFGILGGGKADETELLSERLRGRQALG